MHLPNTANPPPVLVIGAGVGGLALAARLAHRGLPVQVLEKEPQVGGKMRVIPVAPGVSVDGGPTVLTMRWVFDELFRELGDELDRHVTLAPLDVLARHSWPDGVVFDLFRDRDRSAQAISEVFGAREGEAYRRFSRYCEGILATVREPFLRRPLPRLADMMSLEALRQARALAGIDATRTMWDAVRSFFREPRLQMLFGRYATYVGSSPLEAPATLNVIAAVEQAGAWVVRGGMKELAKALRELAERQGAEIRTGVQVTRIMTEQGRACGVKLCSGEELRASAVVTNGDVAHLRTLLGPLGSKAPRPGVRSLSAFVMTGLYEVTGFPLDHHNVFFSRDYPQEFSDLFEQRRMPSEPTLYVCAQDRGPYGGVPAGPERLLILSNAPAIGDEPGAFPEHEVTAWESKILELLSKQGLRLTPRGHVTTTPTGFEQLFPATGGALYGPASHGMLSAFARPSCRTSIPGLYAVGGSAHPGAGVPMVALSARIAEQRLLSDLGATLSYRTGATPGGTSTASATVGASV
ncbi:MAG: phytoene desaturase family protein [Myxococcales bacterium]|nr:phytoene desaturase family protein [Polyangiaceae bacterium]MDW8248877.1 phytoene desaturase family protein [Myxococcales bacterium]